MKTKIKITYCTLVLIFLMIVIAGCTPLYTSSRDDIQQRGITDIEKTFISTKYELIHKVKELPEPISAFLLHRVKDMANPGEPYNATDMIVPSLPFTQLTWAGISKETGFILYKRGGFAPHQRLLIIELRDGQIIKSVELIVPYYIDQIIDLKNFVESGKARIIN